MEEPLRRLLPNEPLVESLCHAFPNGGWVTMPYAQADELRAKLGQLYHKLHERNSKQWDYLIQRLSLRDVPVDEEEHNDIESGNGKLREDVLRQLSIDLETMDRSAEPSTGEVDQ